MADVGASSQAYRDSIKGIGALLSLLGEDACRDGLVRTPERVVHSIISMATPPSESVDDILSATFEADYDEMVVVRGIPFVSLCEHHLMPFWGAASVGYLPRDGTVIGLSKIPRLVRYFSRRLQLQERMTQRIAESIMDCERLSPLGVGVIITGQHSCMKFRGAESEGSMVTSCLLGVFRNSDVRAEFLSLRKGGDYGS